jgi:uncharacterized protein (TIGR02118 family)
MIRLVFFLRRRQHLSLEEFHRYWRDEHGPLMASFQHALGALRYTQSHRLDEADNERMARARGAMEPAYDGVAETWFASEAALVQAARSDAGRRAGRALIEDEGRFIDLPGSPLWLAHDHPQINPNPENVVARTKSTIVKLHFPLRQPAGMSILDAQHYWLAQHGPLIRSLAPAMGMLKYQQVHRYESAFEAELRKARGTVADPYLGHAEAWTDRGTPRNGPEVRAAGRAAIEDERVFIDFARSAIWIGKEHVFIDRW